MRREQARFSSQALTVPHETVQLPFALRRLPTTLNRRQLSQCGPGYLQNQAATLFRSAVFCRSQYNDPAIRALRQVRPEAVSFSKLDLVRGLIRESRIDRRSGQFERRQRHMSRKARAQRLRDAEKRPLVRNSIFRNELQGFGDAGSKYAAGQTSLTLVRVCPMKCIYKAADVVWDRGLTLLVFLTPGFCWFFGGQRLERRSQARAWRATVG
jgi:hypothetical protein